ncbi:MAG: hypothetical protein CMF42_05540 [Legionellales bacterium]|nr:hypothetical protein [Legionellales bacterium]OUX66874.1 MAG: hypothetical protein CBD38_03885 [bacterium TMED178]|tara:strand:- start:12091 stop:13035 length:945 start_codon:yes stop_codon:yes gene_type:complete
MAQSFEKYLGDLQSNGEVISPKHYLDFYNDKDQQTVVNQFVDEQCIKRPDAYKKAIKLAYREVSEDKMKAEDVEYVLGKLLSLGKQISEANPENRARFLQEVKCDLNWKNCPNKNLANTITVYQPWIALFPQNQQNTKRFQVITRFMYELSAKTGKMPTLGFIRACMRNQKVAALRELTKIGTTSVSGNEVYSFKSDSPQDQLKTLLTNEFTEYLQSKKVQCTVLDVECIMKGSCPKGVKEKKFKVMQSMWTIVNSPTYEKTAMNQALEAIPKSIFGLSQLKPSRLVKIKDNINGLADTLSSMSREERRSNLRQ